MSVVQRWSGTEVRALREALRLTIRAFADHLGVTTRTVSTWVAGHHANVPGPGSQEVLDAALQMASSDARERFFAILSQSAPHAGTAPHVPSGSPSAPTAPVAPSTVVSLDEVTADLGQMRSFSHAVVGGVVGTALLDHIDTEVRRLALGYMNTPLPDLFDQIKELRGGVFTMIAANRYPAQLRRLHLAAARLCGLLSHVLMDSGHYPEATTVAATAWVCAEPAGHPNTSAWVRGIQSLAAYWSGDLRAAASLAELGISLASSGPTTVRLPALLARATAKRGDVVATTAALAAVDRARERLIENGDELGGLFDFPAAKQATYAGTALLTLGGPRHAAKAIAQSHLAIGLYRVAEGTQRSVPDILAAHLDLATAHLTLGDLDAVGEHIHTVINARNHHRTASVRKRGSVLAATLASRPGKWNSLSSDLTEALAEL